MSALTLADTHRREYRYFVGMKSMSMVMSMTTVAAVARLVKQIKVTCCSSVNSGNSSSTLILVFWWIVVDCQHLTGNFQRDT